MTTQGHGSDLLDELLAECRSLQLSTINADGSPHLVTMWYGLLGGEVVFWTQRTSQKLANLRRDPRLACLVEAGETYQELRGASLSGRAELVEDEDRLIEMGRAIVDRNFPAEGRPDPVALATSGNRVGIVVHPTSVATWDFRSSDRAGPRP